MPTPRVIANEIHCHRRQIASERRCRRSYSQHFTLTHAHTHSHANFRLVSSLKSQVTRFFADIYSLFPFYLSLSLYLDLFLTLLLLSIECCLLLHNSRYYVCSSMFLLLLLLHSFCILFSRLHSCSAIIIFHYFIRRLNSTSRPHQVCFTAVRSSHHYTFTKFHSREAIKPTNEQTMKKKKQKIVSFPSNRIGHTPDSHFFCTRKHRLVNPFLCFVAASLPFHWFRFICLFNVPLRVCNLMFTCSGSQMHLSTHCFSVPVTFNWCGGLMNFLRSNLLSLYLQMIDREREKICENWCHSIAKFLNFLLNFII